MSERLTDEQVRAVLDGTAEAWPNVGQTMTTLAELLALRSAWKIAEPFLTAPVYKRALAAIEGKPK